MKKIFKIIIALVIIAGIAVGAYFIFGGGTDNSQIYAKVNSLNNQIVVNEENIYTKVNTTLEEMSQDIVINNYNLPEIQTFLLVYDNALSNFELVNQHIMEYGLFVNNTNTGSNFSEMNNSYNNLVEIYKKANSYLSKTYWKSKSKDYIVNFHNIFKGALLQINNFYYNAGMAYLASTDNMIETNNLYKLHMENYLILNNEYVKTYVNDNQNNLTVFAYIQAKKVIVDGEFFNKYIEQKETYDNLINANLNKTTLIQKYISGEVETYIEEITNENQKSTANNYYNLVIKGY